jgi:hypothetical protein
VHSLLLRKKARRAQLRTCNSNPVTQPEKHRDGDVLMICTSIMTAACCAATESTWWSDNGYPLFVHRVIGRDRRLVGNDP